MKNTLVRSWNKVLWIVRLPLNRLDKSIPNTIIKYYDWLHVFRLLKFWTSNKFYNYLNVFQIKYYDYSVRMIIQKIGYF